MISNSLIALSVTVAIGFLSAVRHVAPDAVARAAAGVAAWMAVTGALGATGALSFETRPPTMMLLLVALLVGTMLVARSSLGRCLAMKLPLSVLVVYQGFRVAVELWLHAGYEAGVFPVQMTYAGLNFDILTGASALLVGALLHKGVVGRRVVLAWNVVGLGLLVTIVTIVVLSAPLPFRVFDTGVANVYVTSFPGVWLPAVLVQLALLGHLLVFVRLRHVATSAPAP